MGPMIEKKSTPLRSVTPAADDGCESALSKTAATLPLRPASHVAPLSQHALQRLLSSACEPVPPTPGTFAPHKLPFLHPAASSLPRCSEPCANAPLPLRRLPVQAATSAL